MTSTVSELADGSAVDFSFDQDESEGSPRTRTFRRRLLIHGMQLLLIGLFLAAWQWLPSIQSLANSSHVFDPYFISSPERVGTRVYNLLFGVGSSSNIPIWSYIWTTVSSAVLGLVIGMTGGALAGLMLGSSKIADEILRPFMIAMNAMPRIAFVPIVMVIFGPTFRASVVVSIMVTFFIAFFNAYEGARTVSPQLIQNATVLGGTRARIMFTIRMPFAFAWTIAALPLAASFSVTTVVVAEFLIGAPGLGQLLGIATANADSTLVLSVAFMLTVAALLCVAAAELVTRRVLHWWGK